ncbi:hypothetical protein EXIGLDRAFT_88339 [Exidia glandulosa HHB12029]|uniref:C2H2-type domain-containing protein n=1 Tax=Exidia glandulosa HHB12029 TaxID=1314781 RepID=A0A165NTY7_EXIGL|nr:hypothetical protein EXIGLDRAFT_88339 [Exidia glandulosa HHB12029]
MAHRQSSSDRPTLPSLPEVFPDLMSRSQADAHRDALPRRGGLVPPPSGLQSSMPSGMTPLPHHGSGYGQVYAQSPPQQAAPPQSQHPHTAQYYGHSRSHSMQHMSQPPRPSSTAPFNSGSRVVAGVPRAVTPGPQRVQYGLLQLGVEGLETLRTDSQRPIDRYRPQPPQEDTRPRNHICPYCSAAYSRRSALEVRGALITLQPAHPAILLQIHIRRHTGERPFVCTLCSRDYMSVSNLNRHYRQSHPTIEAPGDEAA